MSTKHRRANNPHLVQPAAAHAGELHPPQLLRAMAQLEKERKHTQWTPDVAWLEQLLTPYGYQVSVRLVGLLLALRCYSSTGIGQGHDDEDDEHWHYLTQAINHYFGERFVEIDHQVNYCHTDFTLYVR